MLSSNLLEKLQRSQKKGSYQSQTTKKPSYGSRASFANHLDQNIGNLTTNVKATRNMHSNVFETPRKCEKHHNNLYDNYKKSPINLHYNNDLVNGHSYHKKNSSISYASSKNELLPEY